MKWNNKSSVVEPFANNGMSCHGEIRWLQTPKTRASSQTGPEVCLPVRPHPRSGWPAAWGARSPLVVVVNTVARADARSVQLVVRARTHRL